LESVLGVFLEAAGEHLHEGVRGLFERSQAFARIMVKGFR
jgi:hypothetical protein